LKQDYLLPFAQSDKNFQQTAAAQQCQQIATLTLFQGDNVPFSETELDDNWKKQCLTVKFTHNV